MEIFDNILIDILKDLPNTDLLKIAGLVKKVHLKKNETYFEQGNFYYKLFYINKGLIRGYTHNYNGEERTVIFRWEKEFGADPGCFFEKKPAKLSWMAVEDTELLEINLQNFEEICANNRGLLKFRIHFTQKILKLLYERVENFVLLNPEERLSKILEQHPDLCNKLNDKHLASYLGITPVSLSRIRKRSKINNC